MEKRPSKLSRPLTEKGEPGGKLGPRHGEAFKLMIYRSEDGQEVETLWNSRDGVTPFMIGGRAAPGDPERMLQHVHWGADTYAPWHVPNIGERVFVDLTMERAIAEVVYLFQCHPDMVEGDRDRDELIESTAREWVGEGQQPDVVIVDAALQRVFYERVRRQEERMREMFPRNKEKG